MNVDPSPSLMGSHLLFCCYPNLDLEMEFTYRTKPSIQIFHFYNYELACNSTRRRGKCLGVNVWNTDRKKKTHWDLEQSNSV